MHELWNLFELRPGLERFLPRDRHVGPPLDRQAACLPATLSAATATAEQLRGGLSRESSAAELFLRTLGAFAPELLCLVVCLRPERLHQIRPLFGGQSGHRCRSEERRVGKECRSRRSPEQYKTKKYMN